MENSILIKNIRAVDAENDRMADVLIEDGKMYISEIPDSLIKKMLLLDAPQHWQEALLEFAQCQTQSLRVIIRKQ